MFKTAAFLGIGAALGLITSATQAGEGCAGTVCGPKPSPRPIFVQVVPKYVPVYAPCHHHCGCLPPPRAPILDTVAIERVAPPFVRQEVVVSREALRIVPAAAQERAREAAPERAPAPESSRCQPESCRSQSESHRSQSESYSSDALETRMKKLEDSIHELTKLMITQREADLQKMQSGKGQ